MSRGPERSSRALISARPLPGLQSLRCWLQEAERTYDLCCELEADDYVINTCAYYDLERRDFRYDCHFSQRLVEESDLDDMMDAFFRLQNPNKLGMGPLI